VLSDPQFAHEMLLDMLDRGGIDPSDLVDLIGNGEPDEAGRLPGEGELLVRKVIDPRIAIYRHSFQDALQRLRTRDVPSRGPGGRMPPVIAGHHSGAARPRERRRRAGARASPSADDDGLADLHRRCPRCGRVARPLLPSALWRCDYCAAAIWEQMVAHELRRVLAEADEITREAAA
jgi:hypothetical protein